MGPAVVVAEDRQHYGTAGLPVWWHSTGDAVFIAVNRKKGTWKQGGCGAVQVKAGWPQAAAAGWGDGVAVVRGQATVLWSAAIDEAGVVGPIKDCHGRRMSAAGSAAAAAGAVGRDVGTELQMRKRH